MEQIIGALKQAQVGDPVAEVIRKAGISERKFGPWKAKYAVPEVDEVQNLAQLQEENMLVKPFVAELSWTTQCFTMCFQKKVKHSQRGPMVDRSMSLWCIRCARKKSGCGSV